MDIKLTEIHHFRRKIKQNDIFITYCQNNCIFVNMFVNRFKSYLTLEPVARGLCKRLGGRHSTG